MTFLIEWMVVVVITTSIIIRGGANIYPAEIESYLATHPLVHDAQCFAGKFSFIKLN